MHNKCTLMMGHLTYFFLFCIIKTIMENSTYNNTNGDEDIIIPKKSKKIPVIASEVLNEQRKKNTNRIYIICGTIVIILIILSVYILISTSVQNKASLVEEVDDNVETEEVETVYVTPDDSSDPVGDYQKWLEDKKNTAETDEEAFDTELIIIENLITNNKLEEAKDRLDSVDREEMSHEQLFRLFNVYTLVFEANGDEEQYHTYINLRTEQMNLLNTD